MTAAGRVSWISFTPVKGLRLTQLDEAELSEAGMPGDRRFHLVDERGKLTNSKRIGTLQQVRADWDEDSALLTLHFPDGSTVADHVAGGGEPLTTSFYGRPVDGQVVRGPFAAALSEFTGTPLRLVQPNDAGVGIDRGREGAVTLLSEGSLNRLADVAAVDGIDPRRFRMNLGVAGIGAHSEDDWLGRPVQVGDAILVPRGHVGRCAITQRHPETGTTDLHTLKALGTYRHEIGTTEDLAFGVYGEVRRPGRVRLGDPVAVLEGALTEA